MVKAPWSATSSNKQADEADEFTKLVFTKLVNDSHNDSQSKTVQNSQIGRPNWAIKSSKEQLLSLSLLSLSAGKPFELASRQTL
ncbi:hypothetical protein AB6D20_027700 (plasmid) [Vibrio splendidus]